MRKYLRALLIAVGAILLWRGIWTLADLYLFPHKMWISGIISVIIGLALLIANVL